MAKMYASKQRSYLHSITNRYSAAITVLPESHLVGDPIRTLEENIMSMKEAPVLLPENICIPN